MGLNFQWDQGGLKGNCYLCAALPANVNFCCSYDILISKKRPGRNPARTMIPLSCYSFSFFRLITRLMVKPKDTLLKLNLE